MEQNIVIYIGIYKFIGVIGTLIVGTWYASHRLTKVETKITITENRIGALEGRFDKSFATQSPISLLPRGKDILDHSGLKKYIDDNKDILLEQCKSKKILSNPYDIQESSFRFFDEIEFPVELEEKIKNAAFNFGSSLEVIRRIGGIYFRDICLSKLGFKPEDLDKPKN